VSQPLKAEDEGQHSSVPGRELRVSRPAAYLLPSVADLIFIVLFFALTYGTLAPLMLGDADIGWHIRNGENILSTHAAPHVDSFSATMAGRPWYAWEWSYDALIAIIHKNAGLNGVVAFSAFVIALTFACVFRLARKKGAALGTSLLLLLFCIFASSIHFLARPHVVGWLLTITWFWILDSSERSTLLAGRADPTPILLPVLMIAWVNLHGSFVMGFLLLSIYFFADILTGYKADSENLRANAMSHARMLGAVSLMAGMTSLLNPYGYKLHVHVYQYLSNPFLMRHIQEFQKPDFHRAPALSFLFLLGATVVAIIVARARLRWSEWLIVGFSAFSGLWAARNLPVSSMLLTIVVAPLFSRSVEKGNSYGWGRFKFFQRRFEGIDSYLRGHLWPVVIVILTIAVGLNQGRVFGRQVLNAHFNPDRFPVRAVDFLVQRDYRDPIFSLDSDGGYLIYKRYPEEKVFIDDRHDFYGEVYLKKYLKIIHAEPGWQSALEEEHVNLVLMPTKSKISDAIRQSAGWKTSYSDDTATVFERSNR
jgi:hypothetical protein